MHNGIAANLINTHQLIELALLSVPKVLRELQICSQPNVDACQQTDIHIARIRRFIVNTITCIVHARFGP